MLAVTGGMQGLRKIFILVRAKPPALVKRYVLVLSLVLARRGGKPRALPDFMRELVTKRAAT